MKRYSLLIKKIATLVSLASIALGFWANVGGFYDFSKRAVGFLHRQYKIPETLTVIIFFSILAVLCVVILLHLSKEEQSEEARIALDEEKNRERYLQFSKRESAANLANSTQHATYLELQLKNAEPMVFPLTVTYQSTNNESLDSIEPLLQQTPFSLLVLGAPGAGKTTTMLKCLDSCLQKATEHKEYPLPLMISLSKWKRKQHNSEEYGMGKDKEKIKPYTAKNFEDWIIKSVCAVRGSSLKENLVRKWMDEQQIIIFFDGLDEMEEHLRAEMIIYINRFLAKFPAISVMVCSRIIDYETLVEQSAIKLRLSNAIKINPLSDTQIENYLLAANKPKLKAFIYQDDELKEMARSPLELSIMVTAYNSQRFAEKINASGNSITEKRFVLFDAYAHAMMHREYSKRQGDRFSSENILMPDKEVPEQKVTRLYRYFSTIANLLSTNSQTFFSRNKLFEYYQQYQPGKKRYKILVDLTLLSAIFLLALPLSYKILPAWIQIFMLVSTGISYLCAAHYTENTFEEESYLKDKAPKPATLTAIHLLAYLPLISIGIATINFSTRNLKSNGSLLPWTISLGYFLGLAIIFYQKDRETQKEKPEKIKSKGQFLLLPVLITLPALAIVYLMKGEYHWSLASYLILVSANLAHRYFYTQSRPNKTSISIWIAANFISILTILIASLPQTSERYLLISELILLLTASLFLSFFDLEKKSILGIFFGIVISIPLLLTIKPNIALGIGIAISVFLFNFSKKQSDKLYLFLGSRIIISYLKFSGQLPLFFTRFIRYGKNTLLLKGNTTEFEFIHRKIRDYFAVYSHVPGMMKLSVEEKEQMIKKISSYKDASCDILLELINDQDKRIRMTCIKALGEIGTVVAVNTLFKGASQTSGKLRSLILKQISDIQNRHAVPALIAHLEKMPIESDLFEITITVLTKNSKNIETWENTEKIKAYAAKIEDFYKFSSIKYELNRVIQKRQLSLIIKSEDMFAELNIDDLPLSDLEEFLPQKMKAMSQDDLLRLITHQSREISLYAFKTVFTKDTTSALEHLIKHLSKTRLSWYYALKLIEKEQILKHLDESHWYHKDVTYFATVAELVFHLDKSSFEDFILRQPDTIKLSFNSEIIKLLSETPIIKTIPFLINSYKFNIQSREVIAKTLLKYPIQDHVADYFAYINETGDDESIVPFVYLLIYLDSELHIPLMKTLLDSNNPGVRNAAIYTMAFFFQHDTRETLLNQFESKDPLYLENLIYALTNLKEASITPSLPALFRAHYALREIILVALFSFQSIQEIEEIAQCVISEAGLINNSSLSANLANQIFHSGKPEMAMDLLFAPAIKKEDTYIIPNEVPEILAGKTNTLYRLYREDRPLEEDEQWINIRSLNNALDQHAYIYAAGKNIFYEYANISEENGRIIDFIAAYDIELAKFLTLGLTAPEKNIAELISDIIQNEAEVERKSIISLLIHHLNLRQESPALQGYLKEREDMELYSASAAALLHFKDENSLNQVITNLEDSKYEIVILSLNAIFSHSKGTLETADIIRLFIESKNFREIVSLERFSYIQLSQQDLIALMSMPEAHVRYCAASYCAMQEDAGLVSTLCSLLDDTTEIFVEKTQSIDTIANAARNALEEIGTIQAVEELKKRNLL